MSWLSALQSMARLTPSAVSKVVETLIPGAKPVLDAVGKIRDLYAEKREEAEKSEILKALEITEEKLNIFDRMFILLGRDCVQLLERVDALEREGQDATDDILLAILARPELQSQFDTIGRELAGRVDVLEFNVQRLDERFASLGAFVSEVQSKQMSDTEMADFRAFRQAKAFQQLGQFRESEPILLELAKSQPRSLAVVVSHAVAIHDDPTRFEYRIRRAIQLRPEEEDLKRLASAATEAMMRARTPIAPQGSDDVQMPKKGDVLDGWLLETRLGGGGWGVVFRATKKGQTRAVKVMRPTLAQHSEFVDTFTDEVFKLLRLRHPNIVAIERNGFCRSFQTHYFVMELVEGLNLEEYLATYGRPTPDLAMTWLSGLLDGLEHSHANGLIHRDVKPQNVIIQPIGEAVLIDFGIAGFDGVKGHTHVAGKSSYFAPPEVHGLGEADARADFFMLAATLFYAFRYEASSADRHWTEFDTDLVPSQFRRALEASLAQKRSRRPSSASAMRSLLDPMTFFREKWLDIEREYGEWLAFHKSHSGATAWLKERLSRTQSWRLAAEGGCVCAMILFGYWLGSGLTEAVNYTEAIKWYSLAARAGNTTAMCNIGLIYDAGIGIHQDYELAMQWYRMAAEAGDPTALHSIGVLYHAGHGVTKDIAEAIRWYDKAAKRGNSVAMYQLGKSYWDGHGVNRDLGIAMAWFRLGAHANNPDAMFEIGLIYWYGLNRYNNEEEAITWFRLAADAGHPGRDDIMFRIGEMYECGKDIAKDIGESRRWFQKAADAGHAHAMYRVGQMYQRGEGFVQDIAEARRWFQKAANAGNADSMFELAIIHERGVDMPPDSAESLRWYRRAADNGQCDAMFHIGILFWTGEYVDEDKAAAIRWFRLAADAGHAGRPDIMFRIGEMCETGEGVAQDIRESRRWFQRAADAGHADAMFRIGEMHELDHPGEMCDHEDEEAMEWYLRAAHAGHAKAMFRLGQFYENPADLDTYDELSFARDEEAMEWYLRAAHAGHAKAMFRIGEMYEAGRGVVQDSTEGMRWFARAADTEIVTVYENILGQIKYD